MSMTGAASDNHDTIVSEAADGSARSFYLKIELIKAGIFQIVVSLVIIFGLHYYNNYIESLDFSTYSIGKRVALDLSLFISYILIVLFAINAFIFAATFYDIATNESELIADKYVWTYRINAQRWADKHAIEDGVFGDEEEQRELFADRLRFYVRCSLFSISLTCLTETARLGYFYYSSRLIELNPLSEIKGLAIIAVMAFVLCVWIKRSFRSDVEEYFDMSETMATFSNAAFVQSACFIFAFILFLTVFVSNIAYFPLFVFDNYLSTSAASLVGLFGALFGLTRRAWETDERQYWIKIFKAVTTAMVVFYLLMVLTGVITKYALDQPNNLIYIPYIASFCCLTWAYQSPILKSDRDRFFSIRTLPFSITLIFAGATIGLAFVVSIENYHFQTSFFVNIFIAVNVISSRLMSSDKQSVKSYRVASVFVTGIFFGLIAFTSTAAWLSFHSQEFWSPALAAASAFFNAGAIVAYFHCHRRFGNPVIGMVDTVISGGCIGLQCAYLIVLYNNHSYDEYHRTIFFASIAGIIGVFMLHHSTMLIKATIWTTNISRKTVEILSDLIPAIFFAAMLGLIALISMTYMTRPQVWNYAPLGYLISFALVLCGAPCFYRMVLHLGKVAKELRYSADVGLANRDLTVANGAIATERQATHHLRGTTRPVPQIFED